MSERAKYHRGLWEFHLNHLLSRRARSNAGFSAMKKHPRGTDDEDGISKEALTDVGSFLFVSPRVSKVLSVDNSKAGPRPQNLSG